VFYIIALLAAFLVMISITQYLSEGRVNLGKMIDQDSGQELFWKRNNQHLEYVDSYPKTSLVTARDRKTGQTALLDLGVVVTAEVLPASCESAGQIPSEMLFPGAAEVTCFDIAKPDTGAGFPFVVAASFTAKANVGKVAQFYRDLFTRRGMSVMAVQDSSRATILEAEDGAHNSVARISIRGPFDTANAFLACTH